ncbi:hypothetical protein OHR68_13760 [Spirillospora sp. NBC_00431]
MTIMSRAVMGLTAAALTTSAGLGTAGTAHADRPTDPGAARTATGTMAGTTIAGGAAKAGCSRIVIAAPGHWTEDRWCHWGTPPGPGPFKVGFWWNIAVLGTNQTACVEAKADAKGPWTGAGCGKGGKIGLPAPGNSIGGYQVRVRSTQPFSIAEVRWGAP